MNLLVELDLSQAESRLVDGASGDRRALELARTPPDQLDQHALMASEVLSYLRGELVAADAVTKRDRNVIGKKGRHATNYGEGGLMMSDSLIKETDGEVVLTPEECDEIIQAIMTKRPYIPAWQAWVRRCGLEEGVLRNSWGVEYVCQAWEISKQDYKEWYAWGPQGEVGRLSIRGGVVPVRRFLRRQQSPVKLIAQWHDAIGLDGPPWALWDAAQEALVHMTAERSYPGVAGAWTLAMPCGMKVGRNWKDMHEWRVAPRGPKGRDEFADVCRSFGVGWKGQACAGT